MSSDEPLSKRPQETPFHQQTLLAWKPMILMSTVFPYFAGIGLVFVIIGVILFMISMSVNELTVDYTNCISSDAFNGSSDYCWKVLDRNATSKFKSCICIVPFEIKKSFNGQVYLYYLIQNLYQNHRRYVKSKDDSQLAGRFVEKVTSDCDPYGSVMNGTNVLNYAPCGIIANSIFNDTFQLRYVTNESTYPVSMTSKGIAWKADTDIIYGKPKNWDLTLTPINWPKSQYARNNDSYKGDEELLVWMRVAPLSVFKKLHRIIKNDKDPFKSGLPAGQYVLEINYAYPVTMFQGRKSVVLSTTSFMGGKSNNMAIMYIVVGSLKLIIGLVFGLYTLVRKKTRHLELGEELDSRTVPGFSLNSGDNRNQSKEYRPDRTTESEGALFQTLL